MKLGNIATRRQTVKWMIAVLFLGTVIPSLAQSSPRRAPRVVLVSIPDRKLAVLETAGLLPDCSGSGSESESDGRVCNREPGRQSNLLPRRNCDGGGQGQSGRHALDRVEREGIWDTRNECAEIGRTCDVARMHPAEKSRRGEALRHAASGRRCGDSR
jgi:hypothetical protein